jgi:hypothetical protein
MGADFVFQTLPKFDIIPARIQLLNDTIDAWDDKDLPDMSDILEQVLSYESTIEDIKSLARENLKELETIPNSREVGIYHRPGEYDEWITGGCTWGDSPTDAFDIFAFFGMIDSLYDDIMLFAREDVS